MLLSNSRYNKLLREYDYRQQKNKYELNNRKEEIYKVIPEMEKIDDELISASIKSAKLSLMGDDSGIKTLQETIGLVSSRRKNLLLEYGYDIHYLDPTYDCIQCKDTGYIEKEKCSCLKRAIIDEIYAQSNLKKILDKENFSTFSFDYYTDDYIDPTVRLSPRNNMENVYNSCKEFIRDFDTQVDNLILVGNPGVGKTFVANCIANDLLTSGHTVIYLTAFQLFDLFEKLKFNKDDNTTDFQAQFDYILDCDLLIIDDLGTELNNTFVNVQLYLCINERFLRDKSTIISTNYNINDIKNMYSERIFSRIASNYTLLKIIGEDIRFKKLF